MNVVGRGSSVPKSSGKFPAQRDDEGTRARGKCKIYEFRERRDKQNFIDELIDSIISYFCDTLGQLGYDTLYNREKLREKIMRAITISRYTAYVYVRPIENEEYSILVRIYLRPHGKHKYATKYPSYHIKRVKHISEVLYYNNLQTAVIYKR